MTASQTFRDITSKLSAAGPGDFARFLLAELNDLLTAADGQEIESLTAPSVSDSYLANYVAAMVELAAHKEGVLPPRWTSEIEPLPRPVFAVPWMSLRPHLLLESPIPFRRRNIFIDSSIGARV